MPRGFALLDPEEVRALGKKGGERAHELGKAHEFTRDEARAANETKKRKRRGARAEEKTG